MQPKTLPLLQGIYSFLYSVDIFKSMGDLETNFFVLILLYSIIYVLENRVYGVSESIDTEIDRDIMAVSDIMGTDYVIIKICIQTLMKVETFRSNVCSLEIYCLKQGRI